MTSTRGNAVRVLVASGTSVLLAGLTVGATAGTAEAESAPAAKATVSYMSFNASKDVVTSKGKRLTITVGAGKNPGSGASVSAGFGTRDGKEYHTWSFSAPGKAMQQNGKLLGEITLAKSKTKRYVGLKVKVRKAGKIRTEKCDGQVSSKSRKVVLVGKFLVNTKAGWGKLSKRGFKVPGTAYRSFNASCSYTSTCSNYLSWSVYGGSAGIYGSQTAKRATLSGSRSVKVKGVKNAWRSDYAYRSKAKRADLKAGSNKLVAYADGGKATLTGSPSTSSYPCGKKDKVTVGKYWNGTMRNGSTPLRLKTQLFKTIKVKNGSTAYFSKYDTKSGKVAGKVADLVTGKEIVEASRSLG